MLFSKSTERCIIMSSLQIVVNYQLYEAQSGLIRNIAQILRQFNIFVVRCNVSAVSLCGV